jgi:hypothetical protein
MAAMAATAQADVKINDNLSLGAYAAGSYRNYDKADVETFDIDAAKVSVLGNFAPVSGVASVYYRPGSDDTTLLDVYATYDLGNGSSITGGKFLSWLGFEAFDIPNMYQITYANGDWLAPIPGYHSGVKYNYTSSAVSFGAAFLDAVYGNTAFKADGEVGDNKGYEAYVSYTGVKNLTLWAGVAYQTEGAARMTTAQEVFTWDVWASYQISKQVLVAAEYVSKDSYTTDGKNWLLFLNYAVDDKFSTTFRVSGEDIDNGPSFLKYTVAPAYKLTENLTVRAEISLYDYKDYSMSRDTFIGVQGVFKF